MIAIGYCRVSSEEQLEGRSLDAQRTAIEEYCSGRNWTLAALCSDEGRSARSDSVSARPGFAKVLDQCRAGRAEVVVVHTLDRWSRNLRVTLEAFAVLAKAHVAFASVTEAIDYTSPEGRLFVSMLGAFTQYFSDALAKHVSKGVAARARAGLPVGPVPFGYVRPKRAVGRSDTVPEPVPKEAEAVREVFSRAAAGASLAELAAYLNENGFRTRSTRRSHLDGAPPFTLYSVRWLLETNHSTLACSGTRGN